MSDYIFPCPWHDSSEDFIANEKFMLAVSSEASNMQCEEEICFFEDDDVGRHRRII